MAIPKKIIELPVVNVNSLSSNTYIVVDDGVTTNRTSLAELEKPVQGVHKFVGQANTPANSTISIEKGSMFYDTNYLYIATSNNTLKRVSLGTF
jgi:hypothetical protein